MDCFVNDNIIEPRNSELGFEGCTEEAADSSSSEHGVVRCTDSGKDPGCAELAGSDEPDSVGNNLAERTGLKAEDAAEEAGRYQSLFHLEMTCWIQIHCVVVAYASRCSRGHCHNPLLESESKELHPTRKAPPFV